MSISDFPSSWNFAQTAAESLQCSAENFKKIRQLGKKLQENNTNEFQRDILYYWAPFY